jgi:hypothetical protein
VSSRWFAPGAVGRKLFAIWGVCWLVAAVVGLVIGSSVLALLGIAFAAMTGAWFVSVRSNEAESS